MDTARVTDAANIDASRFGGSQIKVVMRASSLRFHFDNKWTLCHRNDFEMLAALEQHCHLNTVANALTMLMTHFKDVQGELEKILAFYSCFDGLIMDMA